MMTKNYESPAVDVFDCATEAGFQASLTANEAEITAFGSDSGEDE